MTNQDEYKTNEGQTISIQYDTAKKHWEVACWNEDDTNHWYSEFVDEAAARAEFERWR